MGHFAGRDNLPRALHVNMMTMASGFLLMGEEVDGFFGLFFKVLAFPVRFYMLGAQLIEAHVSRSNEFAAEKMGEAMQGLLAQAEALREDVGRFRVS